MALKDKLTPNKKRFLNELGITKEEDIPTSLFDIIESYTNYFSKEERFCLSDLNISFCRQGFFSIKDVVGTNHTYYINKSWFEAFLDLENGENLLEEYFNNVTLFETNLKDPNKSSIDLIYKEGKYYIYDKEGDVNSRLILMKIKYLVSLAKNKDNEKKLEQEFGFHGRIRISPKEQVARSIYYFMYPDGAFRESGYFVINKTNDSNHPLFTIVTKTLARTTIIKDDVSEEELLQIATQEPQIKKL